MAKKMGPAREGTKGKEEMSGDCVVEHGAKCRKEAFPGGGAARVPYGSKRWPASGLNVTATAGQLEARLLPAPVDRAWFRSVDLGDACGADDVIPMLLLSLDECRKLLGRADEGILPQLQQRDTRVLGAHDLAHRGVQTLHDGR